MSMILHIIKLLSQFDSMYQMHQIQLKFKGKNQKITLPKSLSSTQLQKLVASSFAINQKVIGATDRAGKFYDLSQLLQQNSAVSNEGSKPIEYVIRYMYVYQASQYYQRTNKNQFEPSQQQPTEPTIQIPACAFSKCLGLVSDLELFEQLFLADDKITVVASFTKIKPSSQTPYDYYLFQNQIKNSVVVYSGLSKVCEFYVVDWNNPNPEVAAFIQGLFVQNFNAEESRRSGEFKKRSKIVEADIVANQTNNEREIRDIEGKQSFLQNLNKLLEQGEVSQLEFYKMKSQVLENPQDFIRKYQMGTRLGLRGDGNRNNGASRSQSRGELPSKEEKRNRDRGANRAKRYQIPIIVRKYNNVVEKISTSYPLTLEQEQAINLILELQLKGLISEKEAGQYKSLVLQEDQQTFKLFREYFDDSVDQIELASRLRKKRGSAGREESRERVQHDMRLLIKHAKQNSYELLRKLALEGNRHVLGAMQTYRSNKNVEQLAGRLQKIANYYRAKEDLEEISSV